MVVVHYGFHQVWYQGIVKATVSGVFEDLFKGPQILVLEYLKVLQNL